MERKILIVEDDADLAKVLRINLEQSGFTVVHTANGRDAFERVRSESFDLMILDLLLPGMPGIDVCRELRKEGNTIPIVILTANEEEVFRVLGLELGADDYISKPFSIPELIARVRALFRRIEMTKNAANSTLSDERLYGELSIDFIKRLVTLRGANVELTASEFELLAFLAVNQGKPFSRMEIIKELWGYNHEGYEHSVNSHIKRLRDKIERDPKNPEYVLTVWGVGYKFSDVAE